MPKSKHFTSFCIVFGLLLSGFTLGAAQSPVSSAGHFIGNNTPKFASAAKSLGPENPSTSIDLSILLNLHNRGELDSLARRLYDPGSPNYRNWLDPKEFIGRFAPTADEEKTVEQFLKSQNLQASSK